MQPFNFCRESIAAIMSFSCKDLWRADKFGATKGSRRRSKSLSSGYTDQFRRAQIELHSPGCHRGLPMPSVQLGVSLINSASASASKAVNKLLANRPVFDSLLEKGVYTGRALVVSQSGDELFFGPHCLKEITQTHTHTHVHKLKELWPLTRRSWLLGESPMKLWSCLQLALWTQILVGKTVTPIFNGILVLCFFSFFFFLNTQCNWERVGYLGR